MLRLGGKKRRAAPMELQLDEERYEVPALQGEIAQLESELFGDIEQQFQKKETPDTERELFVLDRGGVTKPLWEDEDETEREVELQGNITKKLRSEGEGAITGVKLEEKLRKQFKKIHGTPNWTTRTPTSQSGLLATTGHMTQPSQNLPLKKLSVNRCKNLNARKSAKCVVKSLQFHPGASVGFVAGYSKTLDLFEVDGENNKHLHSQHFPNFPIDCARFTADGSQVIVGSRRPHFYSFDLNTCTSTKLAGIRNRPNVHYKNFTMSSDGEYLGFQGHDGLFAVFSAKDKQIVKCVNHRTRINCSSFLSENTFVTAGHGGFSTLWDTRTWKPVSDFQDEGSLQITAISHSDRHMAIGSDSGVVNIYNREDIHKSQAPPLRAVMNLTTQIDNLCFNSTGELLSLSTRELKNSMRLVNLHSLQCVPNWPTANTPLAHVTSAHFSPNSGYIGVGNSKGKALLYRLTHYKSY